MSAANPLPDSALQAVPEASDDASEPSRPTQPWHAPPALLDALSALEPEFEVDGFDFHDTIPAPPWLDEPPDAPEALSLPTS
ncbi:MAG: hypothetical protein WDO74_34680 [Pseudomonadota bacterium]